MNIWKCIGHPAKNEFLRCLWQHKNAIHGWLLHPNHMWILHAIKTVISPPRPWKVPHIHQDFDFVLTKQLKEFVDGSGEMVGVQMVIGAVIMAIGCMNYAAKT